MRLYVSVCERESCKVKIDQHEPQETKKYSSNQSERHETKKYTTSNQGEPKKPKSVNHNRPTSATSEQSDQKCH